MAEYRPRASAPSIFGANSFGRAAFPSNPTLRKRLVEQLKQVPTGFSPSLTPFSKENWALLAAENAS
ncbi:TPA: hypothetical protein ACH3X2_000673 [Trebouxia sp. C0005]